MCYVLVMFAKIAFVLYSSNKQYSYLHEWDFSIYYYHDYTNLFLIYTINRFDIESSLKNIWNREKVDCHREKSYLKKAHLIKWILNTSYVFALFVFIILYVL